MIWMALIALAGCGRIGFDVDAGLSQGADASADAGTAADAGAAADATEFGTLRCCGACTCTEPVCQIECTCGTCEVQCPYGSTCMASCASGACVLDCALGSICSLECGPANVCAGSGPGPVWIGCHDGLCSR